MHPLKEGVIWGHGRIYEDEIGIGKV